MARQAFATLPVRKLARSVAFCQAPGAVRNPQFSDDTAACMVVSDAIFAMLLTRAKWATFTRKPIVDVLHAGELMLALSCGSRAEVDQSTGAAAATGGKADVNPKQDPGFMYSRSFADPDGHAWGTFHMDAPQAPAG